MNALQMVAELYAHMEWADAVVWRVVLGSDIARADAKIRDRLYHLHLVQRAFLSVWKQAPFDLRSGEGLDLPALAAWGAEYYGEVRPHVGGLAEASLDDPVILPWAARAIAPSSRRPGTSTRAETLLQVTSHSTYHRGQVNARLRELGVEPPLTDFIAWVWYGRLGADWPGQIT